MFFNSHTISLIFAQIILIPSTSLHLKSLGQVRVITNACHIGRLQNTSTAIACDIFGFLRFFCGTESLLLIASLIQMQKTNKFQMNAYCHILKNTLHLPTQLFPLHFPERAPYFISALLHSLVKGWYGTSVSQSVFHSTPTESIIIKAWFLEVVAG